MGAEVVDIAKIFGGAKVLNRDLTVFADLREAVEKGLPAMAANNTMRAVLSSSSKAQKESFASVVFQSSARKKVIERQNVATSRLSSSESERTERIARIFVLAEKALGSRKVAQSFMTLPHARLGGKTPLANLKNEVGGIEVEEILNSVLFGLPA